MATSISRDGEDSSPRVPLASEPSSGLQNKSYWTKSLLKPDGRQLTLYSRKPIVEDIIPTVPPVAKGPGSPHLRWQPLRGEWVAYAAHRQNRTFLPPKEYSPLAVTKSEKFPTEVPPGDYQVAVFENLFPSLSRHAGEKPDIGIPTAPAKGSCEVVVFTQDPDTSFGKMSVDEIKLVLEVWADRTRQIGKANGIQYVMPFENRGVEMGVTLHHPHGQIYSYPFVPPVPARLLEMQREYFEKHQRPLLQDFSEREDAESIRVIHREGSALCFIPVCARYPYETWVLPKRRVSYLYELNDEEMLDLAKTLKVLLLKFDRLWEKDFPYLMVLYQAPTDVHEHPEWYTHIEIFPALRSKDRLKFLAGTELGAGMFVNDTWPEEKAEELRQVRIDV